VAIFFINDFSKVTLVIIVLTKTTISDDYRSKSGSDTCLTPSICLPMSGLLNISETNIIAFFITLERKLSTCTLHTSTTSSKLRTISMKLNLFYALSVSIDSKCKFHSWFLSNNIFIQKSIGVFRDSLSKVS